MDSQEKNSMTAVETFQKNLAAVCKEHGAASRLAEKSGCSNSQISRLINRDFNTTLCSAEKIANAAGYTLTEFISSELETEIKRRRKIAELEAQLAELRAA